MYSNTISHKKNKKVNFSIFRDVIVIPNSRDMYDSIDIWWSATDKLNAHKSMFHEVQTLLNMCPDISMKEAIKLLYQPNHENNIYVN